MILIKRVVLNSYALRLGRLTSRLHAPALGWMGYAGVVFQPPQQGSKHVGGEILFQPPKISLKPQTIFIFTARFFVYLYNTIGFKTPRRKSSIWPYHILNLKGQWNLAAQLLDLSLETNTTSMKVKHVLFKMDA